MTNEPKDPSPVKAGWTPGPWMAAAKPSSIVGWPVVSRAGGSICNLSWLGQKPADVSDERYAAYRAEVEANGRLIASAPALAEALERCTRALKSIRFARPYGASHVGTVSYENVTGIIEQAEAALALARGEG